MTASNIIRACANLVYPKVCPLCDNILEPEEIDICEDCRVFLSPLSSPCCFRCGKEISDEAEELCNDCKNHARSFDMGFPALNYEGPIMDSVARFKYHNKLEYVDFFADIIVKNCGDKIMYVNPEVLIPVPVHKDKLMVRGYNQAEVLARELGKRLHIKVDSRLVLRNKNTAPQKNLGSIEREINLKKAFIYSGKKVKYKSAMLVDDIYTTGATIEACTHILHEAGVQDVYYTSICVGKGF